MHFNGVFSHTIWTHSLVYHHAVFNFSDMPQVLLHRVNVKPRWQLLTIQGVMVWRVSRASLFTQVKCAQDYFFLSHSLKSVQFSSVAQSCQTLCNPMTEVYQASLSITNSQSRPKSMPIESVMPSKHFILWRPLLLLPSIFPSIRVFSNESALHIRWPKYWSFSFNISPSNEH